MDSFILKVWILCWTFSDLTACKNFQKEDKRFDGYVFKVLNRSSLYSCAAECLTHFVCKSINFIKTSRSCELNLASHGTFPEKLTDDPESWYSARANLKNGTISPCQRSSCSFTEKCKPLRNGKVVCEQFLQNVATGNPASASSQEFTLPSVAVDGNKEREWSFFSCFHGVRADLNPWWQVDLQQDYLIVAVVITTRSDCCTERLHDFSTEVTQEDLKLNPETERRLCHFYPGDVTKANVLIKCDIPMFGRYVRISGLKKRDPSDVLQFCEVEIFALTEYIQIG